MRIGASTYSREPFPKQVDEVREAGFDYAELDLTWITWEPENLRSEADALAKRLPLRTAHLPPSQFHQADLARFVGFIDALAPVGTQVFNAHFLEARSAPRIAAQAKTSWLSDLVDAATDRDVVVTVENVDEPPEVLRKVLDAVPVLRYCLDFGHAHLESILNDWMDYRRALREKDRETFDRVITKARQHASAASYCAHMDPTILAILSVLLEMERELETLKRERSSVEPLSSRRADS